MCLKNVDWKYNVAENGKIPVKVKALKKILEYKYLRCISYISSLLVLVKNLQNTT